MIKLICSDLDGTLLQYGKKELEGEIFAQIEQLAEKGVLFAPASGRQFTSLKKLFAPVAEKCVFLCENGGVVCRADGTLLGKTPMPRALAEEVAWDFWNGCDERGEVMLSGQNTSYLMVRGLGMEERIRFIGNNYTIITDPARIPEEIVKVSIYLPGGVGPYVQRFVPRWQAVNGAVAGPFWIDTTLANKGTGVEQLCAALGIAPEEVMAFGDNYNDVAMLDRVGQPYIMDGAAAELRTRYPQHTPRPEDTLRALLKTL